MDTRTAQRAPLELIQEALAEESPTMSPPEQVEATLREAGYLPASITAENRLRGELTAAELLDRLLEHSPETRYTISMQESQYHPLFIAGSRYLILQGLGQLWTQSWDDYPKDAEITSWQQDNSSTLKINEVGTVRSLIHALVGVDPTHTLRITGHFYSGLVVRVYPPQPVRRRPAPVAEASEVIPELNIEELKPAAEPKPRGSFRAWFARNW